MPLLALSAAVTNAAQCDRSPSSIWKQPAFFLTAGLGKAEAAAAPSNMPAPQEAATGTDKDDAVAMEVEEASAPAEDAVLADVAPPADVAVPAGKAKQAKPRAPRAPAKGDLSQGLLSAGVAPPCSRHEDLVVLAAQGFSPVVYAGCPYCCLRHSETQQCREGDIFTSVCPVH